jgi:glycosyltransferase involved in cell wall biosynthesis
VSGSASPRRLGRVVVDFTPLVAGGANGGAKPMTMELVQRMGRVAPHVSFVLLATPAGYDELAPLEAPNMTRLRVADEQPTTPVALPSPAPARPPAGSTQAARLRRRVYRALATRLPPSAIFRIDRTYAAVSRLQHRLESLAPKPLAAALGADTLFCPFTAPYFHVPGLPTISLVHDVQYRLYPRFFSSAERAERDRDFMRAVRQADRITCTSQFVRHAIIETGAVAPDRVVAIHPRLSRRLIRPEVDGADLLARWQLESDRFLVYPANFWPHKNHQLLLTALGMHRARHPDSRLKIVCTGERNQYFDAISTAAHRMGLADRVVFPGFVSDDQLATLYASSLGIVFPSLYEGFGLPVLEAMAFGKPVLCSRSTSLPEVAGDAALFFDPRSPRDLCDAMTRLQSEPGLADQMARAGARHVASLGNADDAAREYLDLFARTSSSTGLRTRAARGLHMRLGRSA